MNSPSNPPTTRPSWLTHISFYILFLSALAAAIIFTWVKLTIPVEVSQATTLDRIYALIAVSFLYVTILITPLTRLYNSFPLREKLIKSHRVLGVSTFLFALLHSGFAFFGELGGFEGLGFLSDKYIIAIILSATALVILFLIAATSFDRAIEKLTLPKWQLLHRFIYVVGVLTVIHGLLLGSDFTDFSGLIPQIFGAALVILLSLEFYRLDLYLHSKITNWPQFGLSFGVLLIAIGLVSAFLYFPSSGAGTASPFNVHAQHIQLAKQAQSGSNGLNYSSAASSNPGLVGDRTRRFTVSFQHPDNIAPNQDTNLSFQIFDASSGNQVNLFQFVYTKTMHLIVVDSQLQYFNHIHPTQQSASFNITTQFPHPGQYHLYVDFQPLGAIEQQFAFTVDVGGPVDKPELSSQQQGSLTKTFGNYAVTLDFPSPLKSADLSIGNQKMTFTVKDAKTNQGITTLKPYLASFGHLVMINESTFDYIHVHPTNLVAPPPDANGGPVVEFLPLGLYGPIKPGVYRVFAQFNPDNNLFVSDFTVKVE